MYDILICPVKKLYQLALEGDMSEVAVVAVSSYDIDKEKLGGFYDSITLNFDDITDENEENAFSQMDAFLIYRFVCALPQNTDTLFVCCDSGESRSSAMAAAIMRYNKKDDVAIWNNPHYHPNPLVYRRLCNVFGVTVSDGELSEKLKINETAFANAFK